MTRLQGIIKNIFFTQSILGLIDYSVLFYIEGNYKIFILCSIQLCFFLLQYLLMKSFLKRESKDHIFSLKFISYLNIDLTLQILFVVGVIIGGSRLHHDIYNTFSICQLFIIIISVTIKIILFKQINKILSNNNYENKSKYSIVVDCLKTTSLFFSYIIAFIIEVYVLICVISFN